MPAVTRSYDRPPTLCPRIAGAAPTARGPADPWDKVALAPTAHLMPLTTSGSSCAADTILTSASIHRLAGATPGESVGPFGRPPFGAGFRGGPRGRTDRGQRSFRPPGTLRGPLGPSRHRFGRPRPARRNTRASAARGWRQRVQRAECVGHPVEQPQHLFAIPLLKPRAESPNDCRHSDHSLARRTKGQHKPIPRAPKYLASRLNRRHHRTARLIRRQVLRRCLGGRWRMPGCCRRRGFRCRGRPAPGLASGPAERGS